MAKTAAPPAPTKEAPPAPAPAETTVHAPADNAVGNAFVDSLQGEFNRLSEPPSNGNGADPQPAPKVEPKTEPQPEPKKDEPAKEAPKEAETPDPLTELTTTKEPAKEEPAKEPEDAPETLPTEKKAADAAFAKLRHQEKENRRLLKEAKEASLAKDRQIAELSAKGSGDLAKENETLKADLAARTRALAELDITRSPEYEETVTRPTTIIENYFKDAAAEAGVEYAVLKEALEMPDVFKRNKKLQEALADLTEADRMTAYRAAGDWHNAQGQKAEYLKNAEAYQEELKTRRESEGQKAADGYKTALAGAQDKLFPALQKSIPVLSDDNVFRAVKEGVTTALGKNLTPEQLVGGIISLHAMPEMKKRLATVEKELADALAQIKARGSSEPSLDVGSREAEDDTADFMQRLDQDARRQGVRV